MTEETKHEVTPDVVEAACKNPGGWVYKIEGSFGPDDYIPPEAVVGAWGVDGNGKLTGEFRNNPKYSAGVSSEKLPSTTLY